MPGSLAWTIEKFLVSPLYNERAETTRRNYRRVLDQLRREWGSGFLRDLQPRHVRTIRNEIAKTSSTAADMAMSLISALWEFATEQLGIELDADPTHGVKRVHKVEHEHEPWPLELIERFLREARPSLRWAVKLALYTGQRRSDLVKMKWSQFDGEYIEVRQQKDRRDRHGAATTPRNGHRWLCDPRAAQERGCESRQCAALSPVQRAVLCGRGLLLEWSDKQIALLSRVLRIGKPENGTR
jgi:integrase